MDEQRFSIRGMIYAVTDPQLQEVLARVYETPTRPRCLCVPGGVDMYVAHHRQYQVKRMPGTGSRHHPRCVSYEPEHGLSGLGELVGEAVIEHSPESVELRVDFPWARMQGKALPRGDAVPLADVRAARRRMSLRAVMHYLFERAGFNRWAPAMEGKRSQAVLHKYLMEAANQIAMKGIRLSERLYVPEQFNEQRKEEIAERRRKKLSVLMTPEEAGYKIAMVIGEFKEADPSALGRKIWLRHMPDAPLLVDHPTWARIERTYGALLEARDADTTIRLRVLLGALVYARREHTYQIDTASCMLATEHWIPIEGVHEAALLQALIGHKRRFWKPLRYDAKSAASFPNVLLLDTGASPTRMHVISSFMDGKERVAKEKAVDAAQDNVWLWHTDQNMPGLPPVVSAAVVMPSRPVA